MNQCTMCKKDVGDVNERDLHCPKMEWITIRSQLCFIGLLIICICACYVGCGSQKSHQNTVPLPVKVTRPTQTVVQQAEKNSSSSIERSKQPHDALQAHIQQAGLLTQPSLQNNASQIIAILPLTGALASYGLHAKKSMEIAADLIELDSLDFEDSQGTVSGVAAAFDRAYHRGSTVLIGSGGYRAAKVLAHRAALFELPVIHLGSALNLNRDTFSFQSRLSIEKEGLALAAILCRESSEPVGFIGWEEESSFELLSGIRRGLRKCGTQLSRVIFYSKSGGAKAREDAVIQLSGRSPPYPLSKRWAHVHQGRRHRAARSAPSVNFTRLVIGVRGAEVSAITPLLLRWDIEIQRAPSPSLGVLTHKYQGQLPPLVRLYLGVDSYQAAEGVVAPELLNYSQILKRPTLSHLGQRFVKRYQAHFGQTPHPRELERLDALVMIKEGLVHAVTSRGLNRLALTSSTTHRQGTDTHALHMIRAVELRRALLQLQSIRGSWGNRVMDAYGSLELPLTIWTRTQTQGLILLKKARW